MYWSGRLKQGFAGIEPLKAFLSRTASRAAVQTGSQAPPLASDGRTGQTSRSAVIKTISISARRLPWPFAALASRKGAPEAPPRSAAALRSHMSASVVMAVFVAGSGALSVLPEMPNTQRWFAPHATHRITLGPPLELRPLSEASVGGHTQSLFLDALKPNVVDDLTQAQAMPETKIVTVRSGDTLHGLLSEAGASSTDAHQAVVALRAHFDPRRIRAGQDIELTLAPSGEAEAGEGAENRGRRLLRFSVQTDLTTHVEVARDGEDGFSAEVTHAILTERPMRAVATIDSSLFIAAADAGIPDSITVDLIRLYSYDIDFQREIQKGDSFEVFYTQMVDESGRVVQNGRILYAGLTTGGKTRKLWRYAAKEDSVADYYDETGKNAKKFLMRTPIDGARLTSGYGMRRHPVLGYSKMHKGVDFGAPTGTPIMAAGAGTIEFASRYGSYGNYIRIRHSNGYKTAYAHLKGFARGIKAGARVTQGQTIGYVGTTGRSTGPHLHYEILQRDRQVNPMGIKVATGKRLDGRELAAFQKARASIETEMANAAQLGRTATAAIATDGGGPIRR